MSILHQRALLQHLQGDNRYSSDAAIITHDRTELKAKSVLTLSEAENAAYSYDIIGIDEGQFLPGDLLYTYCHPSECSDARLHIINLQHSLTAQYAMHGYSSRPRIGRTLLGRHINP